MARIITISSGLARVGKTHLAVNLALELARRGQQVAVYNQAGTRSSIDDVLILPQAPVAKRRSPDHLDSLMRRGYQGIDILSSSIPMSQWDIAPLQAMEKIVESIESSGGYDDCFIDTSGMDPQTVLACCRSTSLLILVITPDQCSWSETYALLRVLLFNGFKGEVCLLVNQVEQPVDANEIHFEFNRQVRAHLGLEVPLLGALAHDFHVQRAERSRQAFSSLFPDAHASSEIVGLVDSIEVVMPLKNEAQAELSASWNHFHDMPVLPVTGASGVHLEGMDEEESTEAIQPSPVDGKNNDVSLPHVKKRKKINVLAALLVLYVFGFFAMPPLTMTATMTQEPVLIRTVRGINDVLYTSWIQNLNNNNIIVNVWGANTMFWCRQFEVCKIGKPENA